MFSGFLGALPCSCQGQDATAEDNAVEKKNRLGRRLKVEMRSNSKEANSRMAGRVGVDVGSEICMGSDFSFFAKLNPYSPLLLVVYVFFRAAVHLIVGW